MCGSRREEMKSINILRLLTALAIIFLSGCSSYPENGKGGLAENYTGAHFSPVMPNEPLGPEHGLRFDWQLSKLHLEMLIQEGAQWCFPAAVIQNQTRENRIARELEGGLLLDAANDLIIQRKRLGELEQQLGYVSSQVTCVPPTNEKYVIQQQLDIINSLVNLLNVDNQFAHDSSEINPKYMGNLAQSANILKQHPQLTLSITGHADATGTVEYNEKLAMARAQQVERYLTIFGLNPIRIHTQSVGSSVPLFEGSSDAIRLTNRRVSIDILSDEAR